MNLIKPVQFLMCLVFSIVLCGCQSTKSIKKTPYPEITQAIREFHLGTLSPGQPKPPTRGNDLKELHIMKVSWSQNGLLLPANIGQAGSADATIIAFGTPVPNTKGGFYRANLLFFDPQEQPNINQVKYDDGMAWIYLPFSDFEVTHDLLNENSNRIYVSCAKWDDDVWEAAILHY